MLGGFKALAALDFLWVHKKLKALSPPARRAVGVVFHDVRNGKSAERVLRIYPVCLEMVREVRPYADCIARFDRDQARQLRRSSVSVVLNVAEGSGVRGGRRRQSYEIALGEARETRANLEAVEGAGYVRKVDTGLGDRLDHIIATLVKVVR